MHAKLFLHKFLSPVMHLKRLETLKLMVVATLMHTKLSVTQLGRNLENNTAKEKSNILRSNRFIGNGKLYRERESIIRRIVRLIVGAKQRPWILVDWTQVPNTTRCILRAAMVTTGRALVLYEEVHPKEREENAVVHKHFLKKFHALLPPGCRPIIVTDAGFHNPWFREVQGLGWDYVGRIRNKKVYRKHGEDKWFPCKDLFSQANSQGQYVGAVDLCCTNSLATHFYLMKQAKKGRVYLNGQCKNRAKVRGGKNDKAYRASANEPWLLATSLGKGYCIRKRVFKIYFSRMQIEEGIRDLKSSRYGFSFEEAHTKKIERIEILLLIAMLASLIAWITGWIAEKNQWHYEFQANSIKKERVLSLFFLGLRVIKKKIKIPIQSFFDAIEESMRLTACGL